MVFTCAVQHCSSLQDPLGLLSLRCCGRMLLSFEESRNRVEMLRNFPEAELERFQEAVEQCAAPLVQSSSATA
eukprot:5097034-Amphidinium_carterae.1